MPFPGWSFDKARNEYYYYSQEEKAWIYQTGYRIENLPTSTDQESLSTNQPKQPNQSFAENKKEDTVDLDKFISDGAKNNMMIRLDGDLEYTPIRCSKAKLRDWGKKDKDFFSAGRVFKILLQRDDSIVKDKHERIIDSVVTGIPAGTVIRVFIVMREGEGFSTCLPILKYYTKGTVGNKFNLRQHAIAHTQKSSPKTMAKELAMLDMAGNPELFLVKGSKDTLPPLSRIHFGELYCFRHSVTVEKFGRIEKQSMARLLNCHTKILTTFLATFRHPRGQVDLVKTGTLAGEEESEDEDESSSDHGDKDDDEDDNNSGDTSERLNESSNVHTNSQFYPGLQYYPQQAHDKDPALTLNRQDDEYDDDSDGENDTQYDQNDQESDQEDFRETMRQLGKWRATKLNIEKRVRRN